MIIWLDAQLAPSLAKWIQGKFGIETIPVRDLKLRDAEDQVIFQAARRANAVIMTKDRDFLVLLERHGPPPQIIWVTAGNTSNDRMQAILIAALPDAITLLGSGEALIEIRDSLGNNYPSR